MQLLAHYDILSLHCTWFAFMQIQKVNEYYGFALMQIQITNEFYGILDNLVIPVKEEGV